MENFDTLSAQTKQLLGTLSSLSTFAQINEWDERASLHLATIANALRVLEADMDRLKNESEQAQQEHSTKSLLPRLLSTGPQQKFARAVAELERQKNGLEMQFEELQNKIDFTPNSPAEQKTLIAELRLRKKELNANKRELLANMREIRTSARQESANAPYNLGSLIGGSKVTAMQRRSIRYSKEAALAPHEDQKAALERQLVEVDRMILWAERFK